VRLIIAECSVTYTGRGDTILPRAARAILLKRDGAVSIHSDFGNKPLNYMGKGNVHSVSTDDEGATVWTFDTRKESIRIVLHDVMTDSDHLLAELEPGLARDGTEPQLQQWLSDNPQTFGVGWTTVRREFLTGAGPVDLLVLDDKGDPQAVEIKRIATAASIYQINRYVAALNEEVEEGDPAIAGIVAAVEFRPKTVELAAKFGVRLVTIPRALFMNVAPPVAPAAGSTSSSL